MLVLVIRYVWVESQLQEHRYENPSELKEKTVQEVSYQATVSGATIHEHKDICSINCWRDITMRAYVCSICILGPLLTSWDATGDD